MSYADAPQAYFLPETSGVSMAAQELDRISANAYLSVRLGPPGRDQGLTDLYSVANEAGMLSTYEGIQTVDRAVKFLASIPSSAAVPIVSLDPDGEVAFDWEHEDDIFSVSLGASGRLTYAGDIEGAKTKGSGFFGSTVPEPVLASIGAFPLNRA